MSQITAAPTAPHATLILLRHGQSTFNHQRRFTGWSDAPLTERGRDEARMAGERLLAAGLVPDMVFTSALTRARDTAEIVTREMSIQPPNESSWQLNERHYGALEGLSIWRALARFGPLPLLRCRRELSFRPPIIDRDDPRHPRHDSRYTMIPASNLPCGESYADVLSRLEPYYRDRIAPQLRRRGTVLVVAHKNTIHLLLLLLEGDRLENIRRIPVPTATPIVLDLDRELRVLGRRRLR